MKACPILKCNINSPLKGTVPGGAQMHCSFIYRVVWVFNRRTLLKIQFFFLFKHDSFKYSFCDYPLPKVLLG